MYCRIKRTTNQQGKTYEYLQIVQAVRQGKTVTQKVLMTLGRVDEMKEGQVERLVESLGRFAPKMMAMKPLEDVETVFQKELGLPVVVRRLWEETGLGSVVARAHQGSRFGVHIPDAVYTMVLNRMADPMSKLGVSAWMEGVSDAAVEHIGLEHLYKALDFLSDYKDAIEEAYFRKNVRMGLFPEKVDLAFFDTTSTYFEGPTGGDLAHRGYSRDKRPDREQVVIGMLVTREGYPIGHWVFPGNTVDTKAFLHVIGECQSRFSLGRIILVGDRGMVSEETVAEMRRRDLDYILGVKLRRDGRVLKALSTPGRFRTLRPDLKVKEANVSGERYIICLNPQEARADRLRRKAILERIEAYDGKSTRPLIGHSLYRRFLKTGKGEVDRKAVKADALFDGKYLIRTNTDLSKEDVALAYKGLWKVERAFRTLKVDLSLRPMYHWTDRRIRGHIMVCFLALILRTHLRKRLQQHELNLTPALRALNQVRVTRIRLKDRVFDTRSPLQDLAAAAFRALSLQPPPLISEVTQA